MYNIDGYNAWLSYKPQKECHICAINLKCKERKNNLVFNTANPSDPRVITWWKTKVTEIYRRIPDFGGFLVHLNIRHLHGITNTTRISWTGKSFGFLDTHMERNFGF